MSDEKRPQVQIPVPAFILTDDVEHDPAAGETTFGNVARFDVGTGNEGTGPRECLPLFSSETAALFFSQQRPDSGMDHVVGLPKR